MMKVGNKQGARPGRGGACWLGLCLALAALWLSPVAAGEIAVKHQAKVAFLGDSITQRGWDGPDGYVRLVVAGLAANGITITPVPTGVSGNTSENMLARLDKDVLSKKPDWLTVSCGVNDVWHGNNGVPLEKYKKNLTQIVTQAQAAGIQVMLLTSTMIFEDQSNDFNQKLLAYNEFLRQLATEKKCLLADLNADMQATIKPVATAPAAVTPPTTTSTAPVQDVIAAGKRGGKGDDPRAAEAGRKPAGNRPPDPAPRGGGTTLLTLDGVHMNPDGNVMMARGILRAFGLDATDLARAREAWLDLPGTVPIGTRNVITMRQMEQLTALAAKQQRTAADLINAELAHTLAELLKTAQADAAPVAPLPKITPPAVPEVSK